MNFQDLEALLLDEASALLTISNATSSIPGMFVALCIAIIFTLARLRRKRDIAPKVLQRAILPRRILRSDSGKTDLAFTFGGVFASGFLLSGAIIGSSTVGALVQAGLTRTFGAQEPSNWPSVAIITLTTVAGFLTYEFAYWLHHYFCHRSSILWRFHAVHHTAESLSALTNFRVHPLDTLLFANIVALMAGCTLGIIAYVFAGTTQPYLFGGTNVLVLVSALLLTNLQHSHFWINFPGLWGKLFLSPAHHQIHHSRSPQHFNKNLGSTLAIWDFLFGTLHVPKRDRENLIFGVEGISQPHSFQATLVRPFIEAGRVLAPRTTRSAPTGTEGCQRSQPS